MRPVVLFHALGWWLFAAEAAPLPADPTRPPGAEQSTAPPTARSLAAAAAALAAAAVVPVRPNLQSVQVSAQGPSSALVDGRVVRLGEPLGDMKVVAIDAQGITLRGARYEQRVALVPGGGKTYRTGSTGSTGNGRGGSAIEPPAARPALTLDVVSKESP